jgi:hypothetical protein
MGLAWFLVYWKWRGLRTGDERYAAAARFWARIFGLNFGVGVVNAQRYSPRSGADRPDESRIDLFHGRHAELPRQGAGNGDTQVFY